MLMVGICYIINGLCFLYMRGMNDTYIFKYMQKMFLICGIILIALEILNIFINLNIMILFQSIVLFITLLLMLKKLKEIKDSIEVMDKLYKK